MLLVGRAEGDGRDDRARLLARLGAYVNGARPEAVEGCVPLGWMDAVRAVRVVGVLAVEDEWGHDNSELECGPGQEEMVESKRDDRSRFICTQMKARQTCGSMTRSEKEPDERERAAG